MAGNIDDGIVDDDERFVIEVDGFVVDDFGRVNSEDFVALDCNRCDEGSLDDDDCNPDNCQGHLDEVGRSDCDAVGTNFDRIHPCQLVRLEIQDVALCLSSIRIGTCSR